MIIKKGIFCLFLMVFSLPIFSQISRGILLGTNVPPEIDSFFVGNRLDLQVLRHTTDFLTNRDIQTFEGLPLPKRKKAFMRHVKHLSEFLESAYQEEQTLHPEMLEHVYELYLLQASFEQKAIGRSQTKVPFKQKIRMLIDSYRSKWVFQYKVPDNAAEVVAIPNSPYYHHVEVDTPLHKQFGHLADLKKVDPKKNMVVLFKELSLSGSAPKISTMDLDLDNEWTLKWGDEVHTDVVGSRIFAALGYDVDHPYFYEKDKLTLVFDEELEVNNATELVERLQQIYDIDLNPFISSSGFVTEAMAKKTKRLRPFIGKEYVRFVKCAIEARPDRVKRIGSFLPYTSLNKQRAELKASVLAHHFIGNWDTREANTLLTTVHMGNYAYRISAVFSDLGTSLGVKYDAIHADFKVGLVNHLPWEAVKRKGKKIKFNNPINAIHPCYKEADYHDLWWIAKKIAGLNEHHLRKIIDKAKWPDPIAELYFHKLASRRASILAAFEIADPHPIAFDRELTIYEEGVAIVKDGVLQLDYQAVSNPESFFRKKGRLRNYGN